jgi:Zn-dependent protease/CBS domain-containing protein
MMDARTSSMFQAGSLTLFRVRGVPIRAHWTLLLIVPYLAIALSIQFRAIAELAGVPQEALLLPPLIWGIVLALALFASVTLHELAHSFVALRFGGSVRSITLMLVGGVSQLGRIPRRPYQEAIMAALGPATSLVLGGLLYMTYAASSDARPDLRMALFYLAAMNLTIGLFNLLPAFPMDGGRVLRAVLATRLSRERATQIAGAVGKICAFVLGVLGLWTGNLLLILIAVVVYSGAQGEILQERVRVGLEGLRAIDLLPRIKRPVPVVAAARLLGDALARMSELDRLELIVVDDLGTPVTVFRAEDLAGVPVDARWSTTLGDLLARLPVRHVVAPRDLSANDALARAADAGAEYVVVIDPGAERPSQLVGLVAAEDIARISKLQALAKQTGPRSPAASFAA